MQWLWIEIAAWWPCSTAQMMFFGPNAASPPKNTPGRVDWNVFVSTTGTCHLSNSMPRSRSIQGNAFSWPIARITSSAGKNDLADDALGRDAALRVEVVLHLLEQHARELAVLDHERLRRVVDDDLDVLLSASSSSHSEALKNWRGLRAMTLTSFAPRRSEVRQQSIAVLPTPMISTRSPILSRCLNATDSSQSMPMWMLASPSARPGSFSSLPFGAPLPTNTASKPPVSSSVFMLSMREL